MRRGMRHEMLVCCGRWLRDSAEDQAGRGRGRGIVGFMDSC